MNNTNTEEHEDWSNNNNQNHNQNDADADAAVVAILQNGHAVNESLGHLSRFQWILLCLAVFHGCLYRVLVHWKVMVHQYWTLTGSPRHYKRFLVWIDLVRILLCLTLEWRDQQQKQQSSSIPTTTSSTSSSTSAARIMLPLDDGTMYHHSWYHPYCHALWTSLSLNFISHYKDALKPAVVVIGLTVQTMALVQSYQYLPSFVAELSQYGLILGVALLSTWQFRYHYTQSQWIALTTTTIGTMLANPWGDGPSSTIPHVWLGLFWILVAIAAGSGAVVYWERLLKHDLALQRADPPSASLWVRGIQYSIYTGLIHLLQVFLSPRTSVMPDFDDEANSPPKNSWAFVLFVWRGLFIPGLALGTVVNMATLKYVTALHDQLCLAVAYALALVINYACFGYENTSTGTLVVSAVVMMASIGYFGYFGATPSSAAAADSFSDPRTTTAMTSLTHNTQQGYHRVATTTTSSSSTSNHNRTVGPTFAAQQEQQQQQQQSFALSSSSSVVAPIIPHQYDDEVVDFHNARFSVAEDDDDEEEMAPVAAEREIIVSGMNDNGDDNDDNDE
ncbi:hypothetical protein ACA910_020113 [Epithemia clementina (nom. ined.)]